MLRHRVVVEASLPELVAVVESTTFATIDTHEMLKVLRVPEGVGAVRETGGVCVIDLFDDEDGAEASRLVRVLRESGYVVQHDEVT